MRFLVVSLILMLLLTGCFVRNEESTQSGQDAEHSVGANSPESQQEEGKAAKLPSVFPKLSLSDSRETENGGWIVDLPDAEPGGTYQLSSDNNIWAEFTFSERMDEEDVLNHLVIEPSQPMETEWALKPMATDWAPNEKHTLRLRFPPSEVGETVRVELTAGVKTFDGNKAMDRDFIITIERFEAPWASMYLKNNPGLKMIDFGVYWASPKDASMVMEFSKPMDKESLKEAIAKIAPQEAEMDWQNNQKVIINFNPQSDDRKTYYLNFQGAKDKDGVLLSLLETIELHVTPDAELKKFDPVTGETADGIMVSGGYCGGVISPDGTKAVCWEASSYAGNANSYRYWLQDVATGKRVFLTSMIDNTVKWNPDGKQFQLGDMTYSAEGEKIETLSVEEQKYILGFDINSAGRIAYLCLGNQDQVALSYETGEGLKTIEGFTHPLVSDGVFYMRMNPSFDPAGKRLAVVENRSGGAALESGQVSVIDLETENKSLLAERAVGVSWSPDGEHIAITKHGGEIDILKPDGTKAVSLQDYEYNSLIGWSPDGKYLLLKKYREDCWKAHLYGVKTGDTKIIDGVPLSFDSDNVLYLLAK